MAQRLALLPHSKKVLSLNPVKQQRNQEKTNKQEKSFLFPSPHSAAQRQFSLTESQQFLVAESRSSERGSSSRLPCIYSGQREEEETEDTVMDNIKLIQE